MNKEFDVQGFLGNALQTGLGFFNRNEQPKPAPVPKPKEDSGVMKWVLIGGGVLVVILTLGFVLKK